MSSFDVYVVPGSSRPGTDGRHDRLPRLRVKAPPADGRANTEAERLLSTILKARVRLARGGRSRRKTFEVELSGGTLARRLTELFGD